MQVDGFQAIMVLLGAMSTALLTLGIFMLKDIRSKVGIINGSVQTHTVEIAEVKLVDTTQARDIEALTKAVADLTSQMQVMDLRCVATHPDFRKFIRKTRKVEPE